MLIAEQVMEENPQTLNYALNGKTPDARKSAIIFLIGQALRKQDSEKRTCIGNPDMPFKQCPNCEYRIACVRARNRSQTQQTSTVEGE